MTNAQRAATIQLLHYLIEMAGDGYDELFSPRLATRIDTIAEDVKQWADECKFLSEEIEEDGNSYSPNLCYRTAFDESHKGDQ